MDNSPPHQIDLDSALLAAILRYDAAILFVKDSAGRYLLVSEGWVRITALPAVRVIGRTDDELFPPEAAQSFRRHDRLALQADRPLSVEETLPDPLHGTRYFISQKCGVTLDDGQRVVVGVIVETTATRRLEVAVETILRNTAQHTGDDYLNLLTRELGLALGADLIALCEYTDDAQISSCALWQREQSQAGLCYPEAGSIAALNREHSLLLIHEEARRQCPQDPLLARVGGESCASIRLHDRDGGALGVLTAVFGHPLQQDDYLRKLFGLFADRIGVELERTQQEQLIRDLNQSLDLKVQERTAALQDTLRELEMFTSSVAHDLKAPLRAIDGMSLALLEDCAASLDATGLDYLHRIRNAARDMRAQMDALLELSQVGRSALNWQALDLSALAQQAFDRLRQGDPQRQVNFVCESGLRAWGDRTMILNVLSNLLENAWKYTGKRERAEIGFKRVEGCDNQFEVHDNGAGFDPAFAENLFAPFERLHARSEFEGNGLGLATVQRIIHRHGGIVSADGMVGAGAVFRFSLPLNEPE